MQTKKKQYFWKAILALGIMLFFLNTAIFIFWGQVNADEGWYLYASRLVYSGQLPYRDFAFTQTPLLPYIYGLTQNFLVHGICAGRIASALLSGIAFILSLRIAKKYGGEAALGITSLLGGTFTYGIYFQSITKTYALTSLFFMLAFFVLSSSFKQDLRMVLATVLVLLAALTRLSAAFFAIPFILYALIVARARARLVIILVGLVASFWMLMLIVPNVDAVYWGLIGYHASQWGAASLAGRAAEVLHGRIAWLLIRFSFYFLLWIALLVTGFKWIRNHPGRYPALWITTLGLMLFAIPNLISGSYYAEYFVPFMFTSFPITGIAYAKLIHRQANFPRALINVLAVSAIVLGLVGGGFSAIDASKGPAPVEEIRKVSAVISQNSSPEDPIFALEGLWLVVEARRQVLPGMTMAQFSYFDTDSKTANRLHLINGQLAGDYIENRVPKIVIMTGLDRRILQGTSHYERIVLALENNYRLLYAQEKFGQHNSRIDVYVRRIDQ